MLERLRKLLAHLSLEQRAVRIFRFVARNKPETRPHVYRHQDDKRDPDAACHFSPALGNAGVAGQNHLTRLAAHVFVNSARDCQLALQLFVRPQPLFEGFPF